MESPLTLDEIFSKEDVVIATEQKIAEQTLSHEILKSGSNDE